MEIAHKWTSRLQAVAAQFLLGIAGLALITFVCFYVGFGVARTSFAYVVLIALVSLLGSFSVSVVLSIVAVACLNYFFVPPQERAKPSCRMGRYGSIAEARRSKSQGVPAYDRAGG
jgi:K+-sensing histidine kinase KdpD